MSKNYQGILGPQIGKIGPVVGYRWKGRDVYRGYVRYAKNPRTADQILARAKFAMLMALSRALSTAVNRGFGYVAQYMQMFPRNVFSKLNAANISGATPQALAVSFADLQISDGPLTPVSGGTVLIQDGNLKYTAEDGGQYGCFDDLLDRVMCIAYNPSKGYSVMNGATRENAQNTGITLAIPDAWNGDKVQIYAFAYTTVSEPTRYEDYDGTVYPGMASQTYYVGEKTIE